MTKHISLFLEVIKFFFKVILCDKVCIGMVNPPGGTDPLVAPRGTPVSVDVSPRVVEPPRADKTRIVLGQRIGTDGNVLAAGVLVGGSPAPTAPASPAGAV